MSAQPVDLKDPALVTEVDLARAAAQEEAGDEPVGVYVSHQVEDEAAVTHLFEADKPGYHGWRWAVTVTSAGQDTDITVSEVVLLPGPSALVAPDWIPWQDRVQAGDLGVGDLLPTAPDDPRLVPSYLESDDEAVEEVAMELGLGRPRVMARPARLDAAARWQESEFGPRSDMARSAPAHCGTCGFYLPLAGALRASFGTCGNEISPADGHVVHTEYGCGAHSEAEVEQVSPVLVANLIYDDALLDVEPLTVVDGLPITEAAPLAEPLAEPTSVEAPALEQPASAEQEALEVTEQPASVEAPAIEQVAAAPEAVVVPATQVPTPPEPVSTEEAPPAELAGPEAVAVEQPPADSAPEAIATPPAPEAPATLSTEFASEAAEPISAPPALEAVAPSIEQPEGGEPEATDSADIETPEAGLATETADAVIEAPLAAGESEATADEQPAPAPEPLAPEDAVEPPAPAPEQTSPEPDAPVSETGDASTPASVEPAAPAASQAVPTDELAATEPADGPDLDDDLDEVPGPIVGLTGSEAAPPAPIEPVVSREAHPRDDGPGA